MESVLRLFTSALKHNFTPFLSWFGALKDTKVLKADTIAGLGVALVLIPQSMAYAQLAGLPAYVGLYASFLPVIFAALFGSSMQLATGPVAIVSLLTAAALEPLAIQDPQGYLAYAALLALIVGVFQLALGLLRLGVLVDFLSHPVVLGFTNAAALIIASSQLGKLFGIATRRGDHQFETVWHLIQDLPQLHVPSMLMGVFALLSLVLIKHLAPRLPNVLITIALCILLSYVFAYQANGGSVIGVVPSGLPSFQLPHVSLRDILHLFVSAVVIALLGFVEAISVAKAVAAETRQRLSANQELIGQGIANIVASLFQAYPVSGSFSRTAVNFEAKAKTGFSSVVTGLIVALTLLFLTPLLYHLPQATLAAVIMVAVFGLIKVEPIIHAWRVHPHDGFVAVVVFFTTLFFAPHLEKGIMTGVLLSLGLFLYRTMRPRFVELGRHPDGTLRNAKVCNLVTLDTICVMRFEGELYFANAAYLEGKILNYIAQKPQLKVMIIDFESIALVDATGEVVLTRIVERLQAAKVELYIARTQGAIMRAFERSGLLQKIGEERFFPSCDAAAQYAKANFGDAINIAPLVRVK